MLNTGLNLKYATDKFTLTSTTSYQFMDDCMMMDQDYLASDFMHLEQRQLTNAITQELTVRNNTEGKWKRATGLYGSYQWLRTDAPVFSTKTLPAVYQAEYNRQCIIQYLRQ